MANQATPNPNVRRTDQVLEVLFGLSYWMPPSIAILYPFADCILFMVGSAATLSIWNSNCPSRLLFTTGPEPGAFGAGIQVDLPSIEGRPRRVMQVVVSAHEEDDDSISNNDLKALLKELLSQDAIYSTQQGNQLLRALHAALDEAKERNIARGRTDAVESIRSVVKMSVGCMRSARWSIRPWNLLLLHQRTRWVLTRRPS